MTIKMIIKSKGADVLTIGAAKPVSEAITMMKTHHVGALLTVRGKTHGIISERDIMHALAHDGAEVLDTPINKYMTRKLHSVTLRTSVEKAMEMMTQHRVRHLPVLTGRKIVGIVSLGDLVSYRISQTEREADALKNYIASG